MYVRLNRTLLDTITFIFNSSSKVVYQIILENVNIVQYSSYWSHLFIIVIMFRIVKWNRHPPMKICLMTKVFFFYEGPSHL